MRRFDHVAPTDSRLAFRLPEALVTGPVMRELPRPTPLGLGSVTW